MNYDIRVHRDVYSFFFHRNIFAAIDPGPQIRPATRPKFKSAEGPRHPSAEVYLVQTLTGIGYPRNQ
jgi:hypothetical protein